MKICFNQNYSSKPYLDYESEEYFGVVHCGSEGLLSVLMMHGGIAPSQQSPEERRVEYHNNMQKHITAQSPFYDSFALDSFATSNAILEWRDRLVAAGWDLTSGESAKLKFIRQIEPEHMPLGVADYWNLILKLSAKKPLLPAGTEIVVTQPENTLDPKLIILFDNLKKQGISVTYKTDDIVLAGGNLGKIQQWFIGNQSGSVELTESDDTLELIKFKNEFDALRYVAAQPSGQWSLYYCQQAKLFDNTLRTFGQPVGGSSLDKCEPQVIQLFQIGNGLFEFPLNMNRIVAWLNAPINPLGRKLSGALAVVLTSSGGIWNEEWNKAVNEYLSGLADDKEQKAVQRKLATFLPHQQSDELETSSVKDFNRALRNWANGILTMENFPYENMVREQLHQLCCYCDALTTLLQECGQESISFVMLQRWCQSIVSAQSYVQYVAECGCRSVIKSEGDIHSPADSLIWFCINDDGVSAYPFDFMTADEYNQLKNNGVHLCDKTEYRRIRQYAMIQMLLRTRKLTIIETEKIAGETTRRHPLILQLQALLSEKRIEAMFSRPTLPSDIMTDANPIDNSTGDTIINLDKDVVLQQRCESGSAESYSSLDKLIQHPFDYVCRYCAKLQDYNIPTLSDKERTMGNVAHLIIEKVFEVADREEQARRIHEEYEQIFEEAVNSKGLLLRQPENLTDLKNMKQRMKEVLSKLQENIFNNGLTVDGCEVELKQPWTEACDNVNLESRVDMLLTDENGGKVIYDFKWSNSSSYKKSIEDNTALQLEIYKHLAEKQFNVSVRTAYIRLPDMTFLSADLFSEDEPVEQEKRDVNVMTLAANSYAYRWKQLSEGRIEKAEGESAEESEYGLQQEEKHLFPLKQDKNGILYNDRFSDYNNLK